MKNNNMKLILERWDRFSKEQEGFNILTEELKKISNSQQTNVLLEEGLGDVLRKFGKVGQAAALATTLVGAASVPTTAHASEPTATGSGTQTTQQVQAETSEAQKMAQAMLGYLSEYVDDLENPEDMLKVKEFFKELKSEANGQKVQHDPKYEGMRKTMEKYLGEVSPGELDRLAKVGANTIVSVL